MIGYPLDSHVTYKADGTPKWDRAISSAPLRKLTKSLFSDGVLPNPSTNLQVTAVSGLVVKILSGFALCNGCQKLQEVDLEIQLPASDTTHDRIDTVVLRLDDNDDVRVCDFFVVSGTAASTPYAPALTQTDSIWEIGLANIYRKANSTEVTNANITDTRYDTTRCGIISSISQFDTTTLYQQIEADLEEFKTVNQADFLAWFETMQNVLSEDAAANLLNMINEIKADIGNLEELDTDTKASIVDAINELKEKVDNAKVDTLQTLEEAEATTDPAKPVGAGAIQELNDSLNNFIICRSVIFPASSIGILAAYGGKDVTTTYTVPSGYKVLTGIPNTSGSWAFKAQNVVISNLTGVITVTMNIYNCASYDIQSVNASAYLILVRDI